MSQPLLVGDLATWLSSESIYKGIPHPHFKKKKKDAFSHPFPLERGQVEVKEENTDEGNPLEMVITEFEAAKTLVWEVWYQIRTIRLQCDRAWLAK